jgi:DNA-binding MarR family transcriptional regulator
MAHPPWLDETEQHAWRAFLEMQKRLFATLNHHQQRHFGLSAADYEILVNLSEAPTGRMRSFELCESTQWEKSRLSHHLKRMEQRGLVNREPTENARLPAFMLTGAGQTAITDAAPAHASNVHAWFIDAIGPERLTLFTQDCEAVCAALDKYEETEARKAAGCDADVAQIPFDRQHTTTARNVL